MYLSKKSINKLIADKKLVIRPLLSEEQIGEMTIDFRLGTDFLVAIQGRDAFINVSQNESLSAINSFFQPTRRQLGDTFLLHPNQTILATTLEYLRIPNDVFLALNMRSSYSRLGLTVSTIFQPGYCGCLSIELTNTNKVAINLTVGARILQARIGRIDEASNYFASNRKYVCQVRPETSSALNDTDLVTLNILWSNRNWREPKNDAKS